MVEHIARVISIKQGYAAIEPLASKNCGSCKNSSSCSSTLNFFSFFKPAPEHMQVANPIHAKPGDEVVIGVQGGALVMYSMFAYLLPLLSMIVFAVVGKELFTMFAMQADLGAALAGVGGLLGGLRLANWLAANAVKSEEANPVILRHNKPLEYPVLPAGQL